MLALEKQRATLRWPDFLICNFSGEKEKHSGGDIFQLFNKVSASLENKKAKNTYYNKSEKDLNLHIFFNFIIIYFQIYLIEIQGTTVGYVKA